MHKDYENCVRILNDIYQTENENDILNEELISIIEKNKDNPNIITESDLDTIINKFPNDNLFKYIVENADFLSYQSMEKIMKATKNNDIIISILNRKFNNTGIILPCLYRLGDNCVKDMLLDGIKTNKCPFSQQTIDFLARGYAKKYDFMPYAFTTELEILKRCVEKQINIEGHIWIANNTLLNEDIRNKAYETNPDYENIYNVTDKIKDDNYRIAIETLIEYEFEEGFKEEKSTALHFIREAAKRKHLTEDCEMDALMQKHSTLLNSKDFLAKDIAANTKSEKVLAHIVSSGKINDFEAKMLAGLNDNAHFSVTHFALQQAVFEIGKRGTGILTDTSFNIFKQLYSKFTKNITNHLTFADNFNDIVRAVNTKRAILHVMSDENTPIYLINKIKEHQNEHLAFLAKIAEKLKENSLSYLTRDVIYTINLYDTTLPKPKDRIMDYENERVMDVKFHSRLLRNINKEEFSKIKNIIEDTIKSEFSPTHKRKLKLFLLEMEYNFNKEQKLNSCKFIKFDDVANEKTYVVDFDKIKTLSDNDIKESLKLLEKNDVNMFMSQCKSHLQLLRETNTFAFYSEMQDIAKLYNALDDYGVRGIYIHNKGR